MTEYELIDALNSTVNLIIDTFSVYLGTTTAYLICAYLVGSRLTAWQCTVVSVLYIVAASVAVMSIYFMGTSASEITLELSRLNPQKAYGEQLIARNVLTVVCAGGIPACLKFMWDVRHIKV